MVTKENSDGPLKFWDYEPPIMNINPQNMPQTLKSLLSLTKSMVARGNHW